MIQKLVWDSWNIDHISRHGVEPDEVEEICLEKSKFVMNKVGEGKTRVIGQTFDGRYLTIFLGDRGNQEYYVVTAHDSTLKERRYYKNKNEKKIAYT